MNKGMERKIIGCILGSSLAFSGTLYANMHSDPTTQPATNQTNGTAKDHTVVPDSEITSKVKSMLKEYDNVQITVANGVAYLTGQVESDTDYENIVALSESVIGINDVNVDKLTVQDSKHPLTDTYITAKVKGLLIKKDLFNKDMPSWTIGIETKNGTVYLSGEVASAAEKQQVVNVVQSVKGVTGVDDQIQISDSTDNAS